MTSFTAHFCSVSDIYHVDVSKISALSSHLVLTLSQGDVVAKSFKEIVLLSLFSYLRSFTSGSSLFHLTVGKYFCCNTIVHTEAAT